MEIDPDDSKTLKLYKYSPNDKTETFEEVVPSDDDNDWESEHPLFMTKLPDNIEDNETLMALQGLKYGKQTVEELADEFKEKGNECFRKGGKAIKSAILWYSKALAEKFDNNEKRSTILSNRAAAHLELFNYGHTIDDCTASIELNPNNLKAYFRGGKASCELEKFDNAFKFIDDGLRLFNGNKQLIELRKDVESKERISRKRREEYEKKVKVYEEQRNIVMNTKGEWVHMLSKRNISIGRLLYPVMDDYLVSGRVKPYLDEKTKELHWPVLFYYDEFNQLDFIQDFCETDTFGAHLSMMFDGNTFCQWDSDKKYIHDQLEVYVIVNHVKPYMNTTEGKKHGTRSRKVRIKHTTTLKQVLEHPEYVIPGYPVFYIVVKESNFKKEFLKRPILGGDDDLIRL